MLLIAVEFQGYSLYRFWFVKLKPKEEVKLHLKTLGLNDNIADIEKSGGLC